MENQLTVEQQFAVRSFQLKVQDMSDEQVKELLGNIYEQMLIRETAYKQMLKKEWGVESWILT